MIPAKKIRELREQLILSNTNISQLEKYNLIKNVLNDPERSFGDKLYFAKNMPLHFSSEIKESYLNLIHNDGIKGKIADYFLRHIPCYAEFIFGKEIAKIIK